MLTGSWATQDSPSPGFFCVPEQHGDSVLPTCGPDPAHTGPRHLAHGKLTTELPEQRVVSAPAQAPGSSCGAQHGRPSRDISKDVRNPEGQQGEVLGQKLTLLGPKALTSGTFTTLQDHVTHDRKKPSPRGVGQVFKARG